MNSIYLKGGNSMTHSFILGSYTRKSSEGIYTIDLNPQSETLENLTVLIKEGNPTYLTRFDNQIYTVATAEDSGGLASYDISNEAQPILRNRVMAVGAAPCYVSYDAERQLAFSANYHLGTVQSYQVSLDGQLELADSVQYEGSGPHPNQQTAHAHFADLTPDNRLVTCDLGCDRVYTYDVDADGQLTEVACFKAIPGSGPRHLVFHPTAPVAYLFGELDSSLTTLHYNQENGTFTQAHHYSTLPEAFTGESSGAAIRISQDGQFLYLSNRGHDSIVVFAIQTDQPEVAKAIQWIATEGSGPRDFNLSEDDSYLVVGHQFTDNLTLFKRDAHTGQLELKQKDVFAPECVCII